MITFVAAKLMIMIEIMLITALIIAIAVAFLCVKVFLLRKGEFASQHIHDSRAMKDRGIHCVFDQDKEQRNKSPYAVSEKKNE